MELARVELSGRALQTVAEDAASPMGRNGLAGVAVSGRSIDGADQTVVQVLLDDDRADFDRTLLDCPIVAELATSDGTVVAREPFDHERFRRRLEAELAAGESIARGILVRTHGELPPPWIRLAFLPVALAGTAGTVLTVRRTTITELLAALDAAYARGEITDDERRTITIALEQRHPDAT
jgi:hypothetical protein